VQADHPEGSAPVQLHRRLNTLSAALFGLSYICPTVVISTFGVLAVAAQGATASAYAVATLAVLLTAVSYGRMAARFPAAGSAYTYVSRTAGTRAGFLVGWVLILDYFFVPMVICLFTAKAFEILWPAISFRFWVVVVAAITTVINILGIRVANGVNLAIMAAQLAVIALLIGLCVVFVGHPAPGMPGWSLYPLVNADTGVLTVMSGAAIAAYSFLGFDAVTTLSEETRNPERSIPRATVLAALAGGVILTVTALGLGMADPRASFSDPDNAGFFILARVGGERFQTGFTVVLIISYIAAVMCAQAGSSRLLYVMGRDGVLPRRGFSWLHARCRTPVFNLCLIGLAMLIGEFVDVETAASCVNFGAFNAFLAVNLLVLAGDVRERSWRQGRWLAPVLAAAGALAALWLIFSLQRTALTVGAVWASAGVVYLLARLRDPHSPLGASACQPESPQ
jgi:amino acid transporter